MTPEILAVMRECYGPAITRLQSYVDQEKKRYLILTSSDHDELGRVLKLHLVMEYYMTEHLKLQVGVPERILAQKSFVAKATELPFNGFVQVVRESIISSFLSFNRIRNRFAHNIGTTLRDGSVTREIGVIESTLNLLGLVPTNKDPIEILELFGFFTFAALSIMPRDIEVEFRSATERAIQLIAASPGVDSSPESP